MKSLPLNEFLNQIEKSENKTLIITPSVQSKKLFLANLSYNQIHVETISFAELYIRFVRKNFINLAEESLKRYYFGLAFSGDKEISRNDDLYNVIEEKVARGVKLDSYEQDIFNRYIGMLNSNGYYDKSQVINMILESNYLGELDKYKKIFFIKPRYLTVKEREIIELLEVKKNVYTIAYDDERTINTKFKHYLADNLDSLLYKIAEDIISEFKSNPEIKVGLLNESKSVQDQVANILADYGIYTNVGLKECFYNINLVRKFLQDEEFTLVNISDQLNKLNSMLTDEIKLNYDTDVFLDRLSRKIKDLKIEYPKYYMEDVFKSHFHSRKFRSNIHVLNPVEVILDYDLIIQIGLDDKSFMPSDEFTRQEIKGGISNIISKSKETIFCTYEKNVISKSEMLALNFDTINLKNYAFTKGEYQITDLQKAYFKDSHANLSRKNNEINEDNNLSAVDLRKNTLSASRVESYMNCPFKYYCDYIKEFSLDFDETYIKLGNFSHEVLRLYYTINKDKKFREGSFEATFEMALKDYSDIDEYEIRIVKDKIKALIINEADTPGDVLTTEQDFTHNYFKDEKGEDISFRGRIDRVDKVDDKYILLDYKLTSSSIKSKNRIKDGEALQFPVYMGEYKDKIKEIAYINIDDGNRKSQIFFDDDGSTFNKIMEAAGEKIKEIACQMDKGVISQTDDKNNCRYCQYMNLCKRFWND